MESGFLIFIVFFAMVAIASIFWDVSRANTLIEKWAASNGLRIVESERRWLRQGSFFWTTSKYQTVFYVTVEDAAGHWKHAYVRVGGFWLGMFSDRVDVRWV